MCPLSEYDASFTNCNEHISGSLPAAPFAIRSRHADIKSRIVIPSALLEHRLAKQLPGATAFFLSNHISASAIL